MCHVVSIYPRIRTFFKKKSDSIVVISGVQDVPLAAIVASKEQSKLSLYKPLLPVFNSAKTDPIFTYSTEG